MTRVQELSEKFRKTGALSHWEGKELFEKVDIMRKFIESLVCEEQYDLGNVYYEANKVLDKM